MWTHLQTLLFQTVMDSKADCSEIIKRLGKWFDVLTKQDSYPGMSIRIGVWGHT